MYLFRYFQQLRMLCRWSLTTVCDMCSTRWPINDHRKIIYLFIKIRCTKEMTGTVTRLVWCSNDAQEGLVSNPSQWPTQLFHNNWSIRIAPTLWVYEIGNACISEESLKAVGPFCLVPTPGQVENPT